MLLLGIFPVTQMYVQSVGREGHCESLFHVETET